MGARWKTIKYPASLKIDLLTHIYEKEDNARPVNYIQVCMLSHTRKIIEEVLENALLRETKLFPGQFDFQRGASPQMTLTDVYSLIKEGLSKVVTLHLT